MRFAAFQDKWGRDAGSREVVSCFVVKIATILKPKKNVDTCAASVEHGLETLSRGWDSVGRRLAGATLSLPALDVDDEAQPLHKWKATAAAAVGTTSPVAAAPTNAEDEDLLRHSSQPPCRSTTNG